MKTRRIQFGARKNTASSRQHASRLAVSPLPLQTERPSVNEHKERQSCEQMSSTTQRFDLPLTKQRKGTTGGERVSVSNPPAEAKGHGDWSGIERPLTCEEAADLARVHPKTLKHMARRGELPGHFRFGRWFFYASELDCCIRTESHSSRHSCR